ncbi:MAG: dihydrodipicolinate synthase family protein [Chloroflexi bacterium]|nr:dihydrodipicolinate synthase family protein [Chloroflexota bacterium]
MFRPKGVYVAQLTPFNDSGEVNEPVLRRMVDFVIENGVEGILTLGSIGEFAILNVEEKKRVIDIVASQSAGRAAVTPGACETCPEKVIPLAKFAKEAGCPAVVICPPYYYTLDQQMIRRHYETIAEAIDIPIMLYHIPMFTNPIAPETVAKLAGIPHIVGMKDSSGDAIYMAQAMNQAKAVQPDFAYMMGREEVFFPALAAGVSGGMLGIPGFIPELPVGIYRSFQAGDWNKARKLQNLVPPLMRAIGSSYFIGSYKNAHKTRGFDMGPSRQPISREQEAAYQSALPALQKFIEDTSRKVKEILQS